jgi:hypothetical protein
VQEGLVVLGRGSAPLQVAEVLPSHGDDEYGNQHQNKQ